MKAVLFALLGLSAFAAYEGADALRFEEVRLTLQYPYARLIKEGGGYRLLGVAKIPVALDAALPAIRDVAAYPDWAWENINTRRGGQEGGYLVTLHPLGVEPGKNLIRVRYALNRFFKGERRFSLRYIAALTGQEGVPTLAMTILRPTHLVKELSGEIRFYPIPGEEAFYIHFVGRSKLHWAVYYLIPLRFVRVDAEERVLTVLENAARRVVYRPAGGGTSPR